VARRADFDVHSVQCSPVLGRLEKNIPQCRQSPAECPDQAQATVLRKRLPDASNRAFASAGK